jgi:hypothetical protein
MTLNEIQNHLQQKKLEVLSATNHLQVLVDNLYKLANGRDAIKPAVLHKLLEVCKADELVKQIV